MDRFQQLCRWLTSNARFLGTNTELLEQFCSKVQALAVPLDRSWLHNRPLHPQYGGMTRLWRPKTGIEERYLEHDFETKSTYLTSPIRVFQFPPHTIAAASTRNRSPRSSERL